MRGYRIGLAFLITPPVSPAAALLVFCILAGALPPGYAARRLVVFYGLLAYVLTALLGIPAFLLMRSSPLGGKVFASAFGGLVGLSAGVALFALVPGFFIRDNVEGYITWGLTGAVSGLVFWLISTSGKGLGEITQAPASSEI